MNDLYIMAIVDNIHDIERNIVVYRTEHYIEYCGKQKKCSEQPSKLYELWGKYMHLLLNILDAIDEDVDIPRDKDLAMELIATDVEHTVNNEKIRKLEELLDRAQNENVL